MSLPLDPAPLGFRPLGFRPLGFRPPSWGDLGLLHRWLNTPHVHRWWSSDSQPFAPEAVAADCGSQITGEEAGAGFVILYGETPIGFTQSRVWRARNFTSASQSMPTAGRAHTSCGRSRMRSSSARRACGCAS